MSCLKAKIVIRFFFFFFLYMEIIPFIKENKLGCFVKCYIFA